MEHCPSLGLSSDVLPQLGCDLHHANAKTRRHSFHVIAWRSHHARPSTTLVAIMSLFCDQPPISSLIFVSSMPAGIFTNAGLSDRTRYIRSLVALLRRGRW